MLDQLLFQKEKVIRKSDSRLVELVGGTCCTITGINANFLSRDHLDKVLFGLSSDYGDTITKEIEQRRNGANGYIVTGLFSTDKGALPAETGQGVEHKVDLAYNLVNYRVKPNQKPLLQRILGYFHK